MGNGTEVATYLDKVRQANERSALWLARAAGVPYKRVLSEIVHRTSALRLDTAIAVSHALGKPLGSLIETESAA